MLRTGVRSLCAAVSAIQSRLSQVTSQTVRPGFHFPGQLYLGQVDRLSARRRHPWPSYNNPFNFRQSRGLSDFHHTNSFSASGVWELPRLTGMPAIAKNIAGGWNLSGSMILQSGRPFSVLSGRDNSLSGVGADFADFVGDTSRAARQDPNRDPGSGMVQHQGLRTEKRGGHFRQCGQQHYLRPRTRQRECSGGEEFRAAAVGRDFTNSISRGILRRAEPGEPGFQAFGKPDVRNVRPDRQRLRSAHPAIRIEMAVLKNVLRCRC